MYFAAILAASLLASAPFHGMTAQVAAHCISVGGAAQGAADENPQAPAASRPSPNGPRQTPQESKPEAAPAAKAAEESIPPKAPAQPPAAGARRTRRRTKKPVAPPTSEGEPRKIVVHRGGTSEPVAQILPGMTLEEANRQRESAAQLLAATESALQDLAARSLSPTQQAFVVQIRQYLDGARSALKDNDTQRAHTLAQKAYLLADDLVKH